MFVLLSSLLDGLPRDENLPSCHKRNATKEPGSQMPCLPLEPRPRPLCIAMPPFSSKPNQTAYTAATNPTAPTALLANSTLTGGLFLRQPALRACHPPTCSGRRSSASWPQQCIAPLCSPSHSPGTGCQAHALQVIRAARTLYCEKTSAKTYSSCRAGQSWGLQGPAHSPRFSAALNSTRVSATRTTLLAAPAVHTYWASTHEECTHESTSSEKLSQSGTAQCCCREQTLGGASQSMCTHA